MTCCKCGKEIKYTKMYHLKYWDDEWRPICDRCACDEIIAAGNMRIASGLRVAFGEE